MLTIIIGVIIPPIVLSFTDTTTGEGGTVDEYGNYSFNETEAQGVSAIGDIKNAVDQYTSAYDYIPNAVLIPILIITAMGYAYTIFRAITLA